MSNQADNFDSLVGAPLPVARDEQSKNILSEIYSSPRNSLNDIRTQNENSRQQNLSSLPDVTFGDSSPNQVTKADRDNVTREIANPRSDSGEKPPEEKKPLTREEKAARAWELMLKMTEDGLKEQELKADVEQATKAIKEGNFEELTKIIKKLAKAGDDTQFGKFQKQLSKDLGINVDIRGDGSFNLNFSEDFDPNAKDKIHTVKTVKVDKDGKVTGAEQTKSNSEEADKIDATKTLKELNQHIEKQNKSKK